MFILRLGIDLLSGPHPWPFVGLITFTLLERTLDLQNWFKDVKSIDSVQRTETKEYRILYRHSTSFYRLYSYELTYTKRWPRNHKRKWLLLIVATGCCVKMVILLQLAKSILRQLHHLLSTFNHKLLAKILPKSSPFQPQIGSLVEESACCNDISMTQMYKVPAQLEPPWLNPCSWFRMNTPSFEECATDLGQYGTVPKLDKIAPIASWQILNLRRSKISYKGY